MAAFNYKLAKEYVGYNDYSGLDMYGMARKVTENMTRDEAEKWLNNNYLVKNTPAVSPDELRWINVNNTELVNSGDAENKILRATASQKEECSSIETTRRIIKKTRKFKIGEHYIIYPFKNKRLKREYVVKKTIYTINGEPVNIVVMKQVKGEHLMKYTLNKTDCLKYHIKFEEGLEVYSMELDWKQVKTNKK